MTSWAVRGFVAGWAGRVTRSVWNNVRSILPGCRDPGAITSEASSEDEGGNNFRSILAGPGIQGAITPEALEALKAEEERQLNAALAASMETHAAEAARASSRPRATIREIKQALRQRGVDFSGCVERAELLELLARSGGA